jgi:N-acetylglucosaminyldiphosphoundecaprenol N-acetyl-beta-D-mannosaminyltransferase
MLMYIFANLLANVNFRLITQTVFMVENFFNIKYDFDKTDVLSSIDKQIAAGQPDYISVTDGVILSLANRDASYRDVINSGMFSICDSGYVPLYIRWIHGLRRNQYCGSEIFMDIVHMRKYRMYFLGSRHNVLESLRTRLSLIDPRIQDMTFDELPFRDVDNFDYPAIAKHIDDDGADIIWVSLGAPKQEIFMSRLKPYLHRGVMIAVGAAFKFYSGVAERRAPEWMIRTHLEFLYRLISDPKKQVRRCSVILSTIPTLLWRERQKIGS